MSSVSASALTRRKWSVRIQREFTIAFEQTHSAFDSLSRQPFQTEYTRIHDSGIKASADLLRGGFSMKYRITGGTCRIMINYYLQSNKFVSTVNFLFNILKSD